MKSLRALRRRRRRRPRTLYGELGIILTSSIIAKTTRSTGNNVNKEESTPQTTTNSPSKIKMISSNFKRIKASSSSLRRMSLKWLNLMDQRPWSSKGSRNKKMQSFSALNNFKGSKYPRS